MMPIEAVEAAVSAINALAAFAPGLPEITSMVNTALALLRSGAAPTEAEQATIDAGLAAAHAALQAS